MSGRRYFGTGLTGFIGREIVRQLLSRDDTESIMCLTRGRDDLITDDRLKYWKGDILNCNFPDESLFTDLIHGAADANDLHYQDKANVYYTIVEGTRRVMAWGDNIPNKMVLSSGAVTRDTIYGRAKRVCEEMVQNRAFIARIFSVIGEEMPLNGQFAAGQFIWSAQARGYINLYGGLSQRSYLHVSDCANWILKILDEPLFNTYDIAGNEQVSMTYLAMQIASIWNVPIKDIQGESRIDKYDPDLTQAELIGCLQTLDLKQSLERIHAYMKDTKRIANILNNGHIPHYIKSNDYWI